MVPHSEYDNFSSRLGKRVSEIATDFAGDVFRFVDPKYSSAIDMFAGKGSLFSNGRWMAKGEVLTTYTSQKPETALAEALAANRYYGFPDARSTPMVLVTAHTKCETVINLCDGKVRQRLKLAAKTILHTDWRNENQLGHESITQAWGRAFYENGVEAILIPSAASPNGTNLVAFPQNLAPDSILEVIHEVEWPRP
ncbi:MAG: hypothetical protein CMO55_23945 [Verrucomicrobiales bacterium]|nr:hypothetical protein [Verrucomicrobiales bacterium]